MTVETMEFQTEQAKLMDIIIHSLYSHREVFLRELISNSCDAIDKVRFESLTNQDLLESNDEWKIKLIPDDEAKTLTISDNGVGMSRESIVENLGTIARSGTKAFIEKLNEDKGENAPDLIGQFGVGFYSCFMVADKVTVVSRMGGEEKGIKWESEGKGTFTLEDTEKNTRGTDIILHLREDAHDFLQEWTLRNTVKKYSDYIEHPVVMDVEREEGEGDDKKKVIKEEVLNTQKAIWLRPSSEITEEQYNEFYKHISHDFSDPLEKIHYSAEGTIEFKALLYLPAKRPMDMFKPTEPKSALHLYVNRVQIMDDCDKLLPEYMRFIKGVVDCADLPLNVSREMLQENALLAKIKKNLVRKVISTLEKLKSNDKEKYQGFFNEFSLYIKEGVGTDFENRDKLIELLRYRTNKTEGEETISLAEYVDRMPESQKEIYYITGENFDELKNSPYLEVFNDRGQEVILMTEPVDEWLSSTLTEYKEKKFKAAHKGEIETDEKEKKKQEEQKETFASFLDFAKEQLEGVKEVRLSTRLKNSASCLVVEDGAASANMERIMKQIGQNEMFPNSMRILELNPENAAVKSVQALYEKDPKDRRLPGFIKLFHDQALLAEGSQITDASGFAQRVNSLMEAL